MFLLISSNQQALSVIKTEESCLRERDIFIISYFLQNLGNWSSEDSVYKIVIPECMQPPLPSTNAILHGKKLSSCPAFPKPPSCGFKGGLNKQDVTVSPLCVCWLNYLWSSFPWAVTHAIITVATKFCLLYWFLFAYSRPPYVYLYC